MNNIECTREQELIEAVQAGRWPDRCSDELRTHAKQCAICADAIEVAVALREDHDAAWVDARVPPPGLVWWRAELRARQEAVRSVSRPLTFMQSLGGACVAGVGLALLSRTLPWLKDTFVVTNLPDLAAFSLGPLALPLVFALALLIVAPLAMYLALSDK